MTSSANEPTYLTLAQVVAELGYSHTWIYRLIWSGKLAAHKRQRVPYLADRIWVVEASEVARYKSLKEFRVHARAENERLRAERRAQRERRVRERLARYGRKSDDNPVVKSDPEVPS